MIPKPSREEHTYVNRTKAREAGPYDTTPEDVLKKTYTGEDFAKVRAEFDELIKQKEAKERLMVFRD